MHARSTIVDRRTFLATAACAAGVMSGEWLRPRALFGQVGLDPNGPSVVWPVVELEAGSVRGRTLR